MSRRVMAGVSKQAIIHIKQVNPAGGQRRIAKGVDSNLVASTGGGMLLKVWGLIYFGPHYDFVFSCRVGFHDNRVAQVELLPLWCSEKGDKYVCYVRFSMGVDGGKNSNKKDWSYSRSRNCMLFSCRLYSGREQVKLTKTDGSDERLENRCMG